MALSNGLDNDQSATRRSGTLTDQHGRKWHASIDKKSGFPVGLIQPKGWRAPWIPDQTFFRFTEDDPTRMRIDYDALLTERMESQNEYKTAYEQKAIARGWDPSDPEKRPIIEQLVGKPPLPIEPVVAAMQGNKYILGLTDKVDPRLEPFVAKKDKRAALLAGLPDFSSEPDELDKLLDIEEDVDPDAVGGKRKNPKSKKAA